MWTTHTLQDVSTCTLVSGLCGFGRKPLTNVLREFEGCEFVRGSGFEGSEGVDRGRQLLKILCIVRG